MTNIIGLINMTNIIGLINVKTGVPSNLFVIRLSDDTKKTLACSPEDQLLSISSFLKKKINTNNFNDDYNRIRDKVLVHSSLIKQIYILFVFIFWIV